MRNPARLLLAILLVSACAVRAQVAPLEDLADFPRASLVIETDEAAHRFDAWVADTPARQAQGLMYVRDLPADRGMIFLHEPARPVSMWMKNTYVELDMVFVAGDRVVRIVRRARPHSLERILSGAPVSAVIELRGGEADRRELAPGNRVRIEPRADTN